MQVRELTPVDAIDIAGWRYPGRESTYDIAEVVTPEEGFHAIEHEGQLIGYCCFGAEARVPGVDEQEGTLDVGYGMHPDLVGRGLGRTFVGAILAFAVDTFAPTRLRLLILDWNERSRRVAEALGFEQEGSVANEDGTFLVLVRPAGASTSFVVRPIAATDLERLDDAYPEPARPRSRHKERLDLQERGEGVYLVAWRGDHPTGWVFVYRLGSREASEQAQHLEAAEVLDLQVDEAFRGQGYGSSLLDSAEQVARDAGWPLIGLEVTVSNPHNDVARRMYERHGYRDSGLGEYESGYFYWTESGERYWDGEPHRFLVKSLI